jgi:TolA-binding protein
MKLNQNDLKTLMDTTDSNVRNAIIDQLKSDELGLDALDGILHSDLELSDFAKLDRRFNQKSKRWYQSKWFAFALIISIVSLVFWFQNSEKTKSVAKTEEKTITEDSSTERLKSKENELTKNKNNTFIFHESKSNQSSSSQVNVSKTTEETNDISKSQLTSEHITSRLNTLSTGLLPSSKQEFKGEMASEVMMVELKTVDYRIYRSKSEKLDPMNLTSGTTADFEGKNLKSNTQDFESRGYYDFLKETLKLFQKEEYVLASQNFESILSSYNDDINALFYGGLSYYYAKKYDKAISFFEKALNNRFSNFIEETQWNLLLSYLANKNIESARLLRSEIVSKNGFYAKRASQLNF